MTSSDGRRLARNLVAGGAASLFKGAAQIVMLPVMGRLLGPMEFGLYATVLPIAAFFYVVADGGLATSLAKDNSNDPVVWSTAFYVVTAIGFCITIFIIFCGFALAHYMGNPQLFYLTSVLALTFLLIAVSALPSARLVQQNDLVSLAIIDVVAVLSGAVVAVVLALRGFGAFSLAFQSVGTAGVRAIGLNLLAFELPKRHICLLSLANHLYTGGALLGSRLVDMFCRMGENIVFASAFGAAALGSYTFANQVSRFLCESVSNPVWSATYAHSLRVHQDKYVDLLVKMMQLMLAATLPVTGLIIVASPEVVPILLGDKWLNAIPFIQILMPSYAIMVSAAICGAIFLTTGRTKGFVYTSVLMSIGRLAAVGAGPWIGATGVVWAVALVQIACAALMIGLAVSWYSVKATHLGRMMRAPLLAGLAGALICSGLLHNVPRTSEWIVFSLIVSCLAVVAALAFSSSELAIVDKQRIFFELPRYLRPMQGRQTVLAFGGEASAERSSRAKPESVEQ